MLLNASAAPRTLQALSLKHVTTRRDKVNANTLARRRLTGARRDIDCRSNAMGTGSQTEPHGRLFPVPIASDATGTCGQTEPVIHSPRLVIGSGALADEEFLNWVLKKSIGMSLGAEKSGGGIQRGIRSQETDEEGRQLSVVRGQLRETSEGMRSGSLVTPHSSEPFPARRPWPHLLKG